MEKIPHNSTTGVSQNILRKLQALPPQCILEVERFLDYLSHRHEDSDENLVEDCLRLSTEVWDND